MDGLSWGDYDLLSQAAERRGSYRVTFLDGQLELTVASYDHELRKYWRARRPGWQGANVTVILQ